jgi:NADPH:quinone reductase-like Zn-dependent oxidoreductase
VREIPKPAPEDGEILIRVHATTISAGDVRLRRVPGSGGLLDPIPHQEGHLPSEGSGLGRRVLRRDRSRRQQRDEVHSRRWPTWARCSACGGVNAPAYG